MQVQQATRRRYQHIDAAPEQGDLGIDLDAPEHHRRAEAIILAVIAHTFLHLGSELASGGQHQGAAAVGPDRGATAKAVQQRQGKRGGFAGAGLGGGHDILACKNQGDGLGLNR